MRLRTVTLPLLGTLLLVSACSGSPGSAGDDGKADGLGRAGRLVVGFVDQDGHFDGRATADVAARLADLVGAASIETAAATEVEAAQLSSDLHLGAERLAAARGAWGAVWGFASGDGLTPHLTIAPTAAGPRALTTAASLPGGRALPFVFREVRLDLPAGDVTALGRALALVAAVRSAHAGQFEAVTRVLQAVPFSADLDGDAPAQAARLRALGWLRVGIIDRALASAEEAVRLAPTDPAAYAARVVATVVQASGRPALAILPDLDRAFELAPDDADTRALLAALIDLAEAQGDAIVADLEALLRLHAPPATEEEPAAPAARD